ncbi:MAG: DUF3656 domain-containing U32 family peptidase [Clostridium sp.]
MEKVELLAPSGSIESLHAAVLSGCDAVYMGGSKFSARAYANNFDDEALKNAVDYCHIYGVKVYIAVNTLIKEDEYNEAIEYIRFLYEVGVDALIIQDLGLFWGCKKIFPDFELHASTQMTVHNGEGAKFLNDLGFQRIVLSRELALKEIEYISKDLGIETEMFVHGALCVSYSGQCLMSSIIGGRSGNRGRCAQPCRLPYTIINKKTGQNKEGYLLSPKDICTYDEIKNIIETGTSSLKIEGRMKRPEYVAGVVGSYKKAIDSVYKNQEIDVKKEYKKLTQLFNREGFSKAYMFGNVGKDMMAYNCPKNSGVYLGKVEKDLTITLNEDIHIKDGIRVRDDGFAVVGIKSGKKEVNFAKKGERVTLKPAKYRVGDVLYKAGDTLLLEELSKVYENMFSKKMPIDLKVEFKVEQPIKLTADFNGNEFVVVGDVVQRALKRPLDKEGLLKSLNKLGDTPLKINSIEYISFDEGFMPVSSINAIRRELTDKILEDLTLKYRREDKVKKDVHSLNKSRKKDFMLPKLMVLVSNLEQFNAAIECGVKDIAIDVFFKGSKLDLNNLKKDRNINIYIKTPNIIKEELEGICSLIEKHLSGIKGIVTSNLGIISRFNGRTNIIGDYKLNIFNSYSSEFYNEYLDGTVMSIELNHKELCNLAKKSSLQPQVIIYGKYELMVSEYCPIGSVFGGKSKKTACNEKCHEGEYVLKDRKGEEFKVLTDKYCRSHIYNNVPVNLIPNMKEYKRNNISSFRVDLIDENYEKSKEIIKMVIEEKFDGDYKGYTRGHYKRGVE